MNTNTSTFRMQRNAYTSHTRLECTEAYMWKVTYTRDEYEIRELMTTNTNAPRMQSNAYYTWKEPYIWASFKLYLFTTNKYIYIHVILFIYTSHATGHVHA